MPYPLRRLATAGYIVTTLQLKKLMHVEEQNDLTPLDEMGTLSFWRVPEVELTTYRLIVDGAVETPSLRTLEEIKLLPSVERVTRMDCVGGFRNNAIMRGVSFRTLIDSAKPLPHARRAIFYCADGYFESITLADLFEADALLVYEVQGEAVPRLGYPLRLAIPGKYGYKWAKWVQRIEIVSHDRKGHWPQLGLPDHARIGDVW
jgi:DMSO/TMAO reductase YedYZ molybdopterin-dependent catalytic subunit